jgi:type I restriction enzyme, S subunit
MSADWQSHIIGDLLETIIDYRGKTPPKSKNGIPTLTAANVKGGRIDLSSVSYVSKEIYDQWTTRGFPEPGDVIITTEAPVGEVAPFPSDQTYLITRRVMALRGKKGVLDNDFLLFVLQSPIYKDKLLTKTRGSTVSRVLKTDITGLEIALPSINEQKKIAGVLKKIDTKIELNRQINQTLESMAQTIFKSWFVDFEPIKAKIAAIEAGEDAEGVTRAAMRAISGKTDDELDQMQAGQPEDYAQLKTTARLFPSAMQDSELGEVPEGWEVGTLNKLIKITSGKRPNKKLGKIDFEFVVPLIGASSITGYVKEILYDKAILVIGRVGTHGIVQRVMPPSFPSDNTLVIQSEYYEFIYQILKIIDYKSLNVGSTQPLITQKSIKNFMIVVPKKEVLMDFENIVSGLFGKVTCDNQEIEKLAVIRDALLPKLMSGEIIVKVER